MSEPENCLGCEHHTCELNDRKTGMLAGEIDLYCKHPSLDTRKFLGLAKSYRMNQECKPNTCPL